MPKLQHCFELKKKKYNIFQSDFAIVKNHPYHIKKKSNFEKNNVNF